MIINKKTQIEMYNYLLSGKMSNIKFKEGNMQTFLIYVIKRLARKLFHRTELYIGKMQVIRDDDDKLIKTKIYKCKSNILIFLVLEDIPECRAFATQEVKKALSNQKLDDIQSVVESGSQDRKKLISLCKIYLEQKEIELISKGKINNEYEMLKESSLAEMVFGKYTKEILSKIANVKCQYILKNATAEAKSLRADIFIKYKDIIIIVDTKVYNEVGVNYYGDFRYASNKNRFQINSYMGAAINDKRENIKIYGIILHIVNNKIYNENKILQGANLTIENNRPIELLMISSDTGLNNMFLEYNQALLRILKMLM